MTTPHNRRRSCWYLDDDLIKAMQFIKDNYGIPVSRQIEMGSRAYLRMYEEELKEAGHDIL